MDCLGAGVKRCANKEVDVEKGVAIAARYVADVYAFICVADMTRRSISVWPNVSTYILNSVITPWFILIDSNSHRSYIQLPTRLSNATSDFAAVGY